jgi:hypothetical protein
MTPDEAKEVIDLVADDPGTSSVQDHWGDDVGGYPPEVLAALALHVRKRGLEWIEENAPEAWYRSLW